MDAPPGTYRHYKPGGRQYLVLGGGHDANHPERVVVIYLPLYPVTGSPFAVRTLEDFTAWVDPTTGATVPAGAPGAVRRFAPETSGTLPA